MFIFNGLKTILKELIYLPILDYWTSKDMINVEGTMITLLFSLVFLTISIGNYLGFIIMKIM